MIPSPPITGVYARIVRISIKLYVLALAFLRCRSMSGSFRVLHSLKKMRLQAAADNPISKLHRAGRRYYWSLIAPGWPSLACRRFLDSELNRVLQTHERSHRLRVVVFGITTVCPLNCEHCYAGNLLNNADTLSFQQLREILGALQDRGVSIVQWSGGEPLCRFDDMIQLTRQAREGTDFWVLTSGAGLTDSKAKALKKAGMTGVNVSLDHWNPEKHNSFRGTPQAYTWATQAIEIARENGLVVAITLCATRDFVNEDNMRLYFQLAQDMGVRFVQILEARAIGHFAGRDVTLTRNQYDLLDDTFASMNSQKRWRNMPIVTYHGYHQRRIGCFGSGDRFMYIDPYGDVYPCPFSEMRIGNAIIDKDAINTLSSNCDRTCDRYVLSSHLNESRRMDRSGSSAASYLK